MSFCCGASMIGTRGSLKHIHTQIHNVPLVFCPVCHKVEVHHSVQSEYEILAEYAHGDGAAEVDFLDYVNQHENELIYQNCVNHDHEDQLEMLKTQIDMALDLWSVSKRIKDTDWEQQLIKRLQVLSKRKKKLAEKRALKKLK